MELTELRPRGRALQRSINKVQETVFEGDRAKQREFGLTERDAPRPARAEDEAPARPADPAPPPPADGTERVA